MKIATLKDNLATLKIREYYLILFMILIIFICDLFAVMSYRGLYSDGANFFITILTSEDYLRFDWHRQFAHFATQWPVILALKNQVMDLETLELLHSAGLILLPDLIWFISILLLRGYTRWIMFIAFVISRFDAGMFSVSEMHISLALCGLSVSLILRDGFSFLRGVVLWVAGLLLVRSYESCIFLSAALAFVAIYIAFDPRDANMKRIFFTGGFCLLMIAATLYSVESVLFPRDPVNFARMFNKSAILTNTQLAFGIVLLGSVITIGMTNRFRTVAITCAGLAIVGLVFPFMWSTPSEHYRARLAVALAVFGAVLASLFLRRTTPTKGARAAVASATLLFVLVSAASDVSHTLGWRQFLDSFSSEVQVLDGSMSFEQTNLKKLEYQPSWVFPTMSVLFRPKGSKAMITKGFDGWEPFDPENGVPDIEKFK